MDRIPFYECNDYAAMLRIIRGEPPKKPILSITRGYTEELWDMSLCCWDVDPTKRPTVDPVLDRLIVAAEQWVPRHGGLSTQDDWDSTDSEEESDSSTVLEPENEPIDNATSSPDPPQSLVIETPTPAPNSAPLIPAPPSVSPPSTIKDPTQPKPTLATSKKEEITSAPVIQPKEEPRPRIVIPTKEKMGPALVIPTEEMDPALVRLPRKEGCKPTPVSPNAGYIRVAPVVPPKQDEKPKLAPVASGDGVTRLTLGERSREPRPTPAIPTKSLHVRQSTEEESKPTLAISRKEETQHVPTSLSDTKSKLVPATLRDGVGETVSLRPTPSTLRKGDTNAPPRRYHPNLVLLPRRREQPALQLSAHENRSRLPTPHPLPPRGTISIRPSMHQRQKCNPN
jgi:hypothetical protein